MSHTTATQSKRRLRWLNVAAILAMLFSILPFNVQLPGPLPDLGPETASAHNLASRSVTDSSMRCLSTFAIKRRAKGAPDA